MTAHLKLRIHVSEPFDFARRNEGREDLTGWTVDYVDRDLDEWEITLDRGYDLNDVHHGRVLVSPRYVGEHLLKVHDALVGLPIRIAHRLDGDWHYAMTGMLSLRRDNEEDE